jgi:iron-sulfur cluster assembly accessory protein
VQEFDTSQKPRIHLGNVAGEKIKEVLGETAYLRIYVQGGGCSGFQYGFSMEDEMSDDDYLYDLGDGLKILIDYYSSQYLDGVTVDYREDSMGSAFTIDNPGATTTCGCGSSFSPF